LKEEAKLNAELTAQYEKFDNFNKSKDAARK